MATTNLTYSATANLAIKGIVPTPVSAPTQAVNISAPYASGSLYADDRVAETYTINASTTATALNLGKISAGLLVMITTTGPLMLTIAQTAGSPVVEVDSFIMLASGFTGLSVANTGGTAIYVTVTVLGNRPVVGGGAGVF